MNNQQQIKRKNMMSELLATAEELAAKINIPLEDAMQIVCTVHQTKTIEKGLDNLKSLLETFIEKQNTHLSGEKLRLLYN